MDEISLTDPEARQMYTRHGVDICYNGHIAVEADNHLITDYALDNNTNDYASLMPLAVASKEFLDDFELSADKGHFSLPNLLSLNEEGIDAYIPSPGKGKPGQNRETPEEAYHKECGTLF